MNRSKVLLLGVTLALLAEPAWAVMPGGNLYIRSKNTKVVKAAKPTAPVVATLQPGTEVVWNGADPTDKQFHSIKAGAKQGFVLQANLAPSKPLTELSGDGRSISGHALASSGAAIRALSAAGQTQASKSPDLTTAGKQVVLLELINDKVTDKDLAEHAAKQNLPKAGGK